MLENQGIFDFDNHYYESEDAFTRYATLPESKRVRWVTTDHGHRHIAIGDQISRFIPNPTFTPVAEPGALTEMFERVHQGLPVETVYGGLEPIRPEYRDRDARLGKMDEQGLQSALFLPTLGLTVEMAMRHDPVMTYGNLRAFNEWLLEDWGFSYRDRIFSPPLMSLVDVDRAVDELDWALANGAKAIHIVPAPVNGRSPADPMFDPFWARVNEAGILVSFHASEDGYNATFSSLWGEDPNPPTTMMSPFQWVTSFGDRAIFDTVAALILHGLFERFPRIRIASIEMGSLWVPYLLQWLEKAPALGRRVAKSFSATPVETFRNNVFISPYPEEDIDQLAELVGTSQLLLGSDWPHPEGLRHPRTYLDEFANLGEAAARRIAIDTPRSLVGLASIEMESA